MLKFPKFQDTAASKNLSHDQIKVLEKLLKWFNDPYKSQFITVGGFAGTGKTTLIALLRRELYIKNKKIKTAFASFTGRAARVLYQKLRETKAVYENDTAGTIHSLIYAPVINEHQEIIGWKKKDTLEYDLIIIDEASMVDENIWNDLLSYHLPIIAVGDHGQLPPIKENFNLMEDPLLRLEEIHRQEQDNPIIKLSTEARIKGKVPVANYTGKVRKLNPQEGDTQDFINELLANFNEETLILCGFNYTRVKLNNFIRSCLGKEEKIPQKGDRVICLRNNREKQVFNGMLGTILMINRKDDNWFEADIAMDGEKDIYQGLISVKQFNSVEPLNFTDKRALIMKGDLFDFGYALTVHKAQGSQAKRVILFEERSKHMDDLMWKRWLYTGITRAVEELYIIGY